VAQEGERVVLYTHRAAAGTVIEAILALGLNDNRRRRIERIAAEFDVGVPDTFRAARSG